MNALRFVLCVSFFALPMACIAADPAPATSQYFKLEDLRRITNVSSPQISPDGKHVVILVSRPNWDDDKSDQEMDIVDVASGALRALTYKRHGIGAPHWSPSGDRLAFLAEDPDTTQSQLFVMSMTGGDPVRLTDGKQGVDSFTWSPDGQRIAYFMQDAPDEDAVKHHRDAVQVTDNHYLTREPVLPWHVWVVPAEGGKAERVTKGTWSVQIDQDAGSISPGATTARASLTRSSRIRISATPISTPSSP